ncbi:response regulator [Streptomyces griseorubiginosus]|uniref:response regulator n=1 Tax=Streptomyces griseorubiginosus TaxID=67304 RepID=UPI003452539D
MRIVIAEDDPLLREGLALLLRAEGLDVVATADTADGALDAVDTHEPDVAILDVRMPPTHTDEGVRAAVEARRRRPGLAVLSIFAKLDLAPTDQVDRRVAAVLRYLEDARRTR